MPSRSCAHINSNNLRPVPVTDSGSDMTADPSGRCPVINSLCGYVITKICWAEAQAPIVNSPYCSNQYSPTVGFRVPVSLKLVCELVRGVPRMPLNFSVPPS